MFGDAELSIMDETWIFGQILAELQKQTVLLQKQTTELAANGAKLDAGFLALTLRVTALGTKLDTIIKTLTPQLDHVAIKFGVVHHK